MGCRKFVLFRNKAVLNGFNEAEVIGRTTAYLLNDRQIVRALYLTEDTVVFLKIFRNMPRMRQMFFIILFIIQKIRRKATL